VYQASQELKDKPMFNINRQFFDRQFWLTGLVLLAALLALVTWQFIATWRLAAVQEAEVDRAIRERYEAQRWALDEWDRCSEGKPPYMEYRLSEQCDYAVLAIAKKTGVEDQVQKVLAERAKAIQKAQPEMPWPLSDAMPFILSVLTDYTRS
jgi:hypothetical protein